MKSQEETKIQKWKRRQIMNGSIKRTDYAKFEYEQVESKPLAENCNFSGFSMAA